MKQLLQNPRTGELELAEVPAPAPGPGELLVRTCFSVVSPGTEKRALEFARKSLLAKARGRPDLVRQVVRKLRQEGPLATYRTVVDRLDAPQALGYSSAGIVQSVGERVTGFVAGDRVACAGAGFASHAELVSVPANLVARVPDSVGLEDAAFATLGAIALQGVRVAAPTLGEVAVVIGLGPIGQLTVQLLRANGCRVLAIDPTRERVKQALGLGAEWAAGPAEDLEPWRERETAGHGADLAIVTASAESPAPLELAAGLCRLKARISLVGAVPVALDRRLLYEKELELRMSTSYGPGRYDRRYEEDGVDYPLAYVRWTENRNLQAFLQLVAGGQVRLDGLGPEIVPFAQALRVYEELSAGRRGPLVTVFRYEEQPAARRSLALERPAAPRSARAARERIGVAFVGAGNYARSVLLPEVVRQPGVDLVAVGTARGASAKHTAERFGFAHCSTDPEEIFSDPAVQLVFIATRHDSHARLAVAALRAGKAVWLEKPLGLDLREVDGVVDAARSAGGFLAVGYNRRFSRHAECVRSAFQERRGPLAIAYRVAAGPVPAGSWVTDPKEGGGRLVGEVCHFVDLCTYLVGSLPHEVYARALSADPERDDSVVVTLAFADGSTAAIEYLAHASTRLPKERFEASADGVTALCDNFRTTRILGKRRRTVRTFRQDKGQARAVAAVIAAARGGDASPFGLRELAGVSQATFAIRRSIESGAAAPVPSRAGDQPAGGGP